MAFTKQELNEVLEIAHEIQKWTDFVRYEFLQQSDCLDTMTYRISIRNKLNLNAILDRLRLDGKDGYADQMERIRDDLLNEINSYGRDLDKNDPMHLPDFGLCNIADRLVHLLQKIFDSETDDCQKLSKCADDIEDLVSDESTFYPTVWKRQFPILLDIAVGYGRFDTLIDHIEEKNEGAGAQLKEQYQQLKQMSDVGKKAKEKELKSIQSAAFTLVSKIREVAKNEEDSGLLPEMPMGKAGLRISAKEVTQLMEGMAERIEKAVDAHREVHIQCQNLSRKYIAKLGPALGDLPKIVRYLQSHYPNMVQSLTDWDDKLHPCSKEIDKHISRGDEELALQELQKFDYYCRQLAEALRDIVKELAGEELNVGSDNTMSQGNKNKADKLREIADKLTIWGESAPDDGSGRKRYNMLPENGLEAATEALCLLQDNEKLLQHCKYTYVPPNAECEKALSQLTDIISGLRMNNESPEQISQRYSGWGDIFTATGFISDLRRWADKLEEEKNKTQNRLPAKSRCQNPCPWLNGRQYSGYPTAQ